MQVIVITAPSVNDTKRNEHKMNINLVQLLFLPAPIKNLNLTVELYQATNVHIATKRAVLTCSVDVRSSMNSTRRDV